MKPLLTKVLKGDWQYHARSLRFNREIKVKHYFEEKKNTCIKSYRYKMSKFYNYTINRFTPNGKANALTNLILQLFTLSLLDNIKAHLRDKKKLILSIAVLHYCIVIARISLLHRGSSAFSFELFTRVFEHDPFHNRIRAMIHEESMKNCANRV